MSELVGRFHPLLVHLPIGILLLAGLFHFLTAKEKYQSFRTAVTIALLIGAVTATLSCITGFLLSQTGDYDAVTVSRHQWLGIATAVISFVVYILSKRNSDKLLMNIVFVAMLVLLTITGHFGGTLTHGSNYLFSSKTTETKAAQKSIANIEEAKVYEDLVAPLLQAKCYSCHGNSKQKGKLRLDAPEFILKGGKTGKAIEPGSIANSELMKRITLPREEEKHMPPKEKPQLSENDIALLHWWVSNNAGFTQQVKELPNDEKIKPILAALQGGATEKKLIASIPSALVDKAGEQLLQPLKKSGVVVMPVAAGSNYLSVNYVSAATITDKDLKLLLPLKKQIVWLKLSNQKITDSAIQIIQQLTNLTRLSLDHTPVTDKGVVALNVLVNLQYLNLVGTNTGLQGLQQLGNLKHLQSLYLYQTKITNNQFAILIKQFPGVKIDTGGYHVATLAGDTTELKYVKPK